jgi:hypothetical protein
MEQTARGPTWARQLAETRTAPNPAVTPNVRHHTSDALDPDEGRPKRELGGVVVGWKLLHRESRHAAGPGSLRHGAASREKRDEKGQ